MEVSMDKTKQAPIPERRTQNEKATADAEVTGQPKAADPKFVRGTIDPTIKKER
jgi:hypothetical protein